MTPPEELPVYERMGEAGIAELVRGFYARVPMDPILGPMYRQDDLAGAELRLREFLVYRFGGPPRYLQARGHPRLRGRHMPFAIDQAARDRWMQLMGESIASAGLPGDLARYVENFLGDIATFLINR